MLDQEFNFNAELAAESLRQSPLHLRLKLFAS
jgi:hypothetical protein